MKPLAQKNPLPKIPTRKQLIQNLFHSPWIDPTLFDHVRGITFSSTNGVSKKKADILKVLIDARGNMKDTPFKGNRSLSTRKLMPPNEAPKFIGRKSGETKKGLIRF
jgi:hypothetical protein